MDFDTTFPLRLFMNLGRAAQRRADLEYRLLEIDFDARRHAAVDVRWLTADYGFPDPLRRAKALTKRLAIRRAQVSKAKAVIILEDDVEFHPAWRERLESLTLPDDWGVFFLGCCHSHRPEICGPNLLKVTRAVDNHAWALRADYYDLIRRALRGKKTLPTGTLKYSDRMIADLQKSIPTYAAYPNVAWQKDSTHYDEEGGQIRPAEPVAGLQDEMQRWCAERGAQCWKNQISLSPDHS